MSPPASPVRSTEVWKTQHDAGVEALKTATFLYDEWIYPRRYEDFAGKGVMDAGSGPGIQVRLMAEHARHVTAVDLEAVDTTKAQTKDIAHKVEYVQADIATIDLGKQFDAVNCVGVIHHTDDPTATFKNLFKHTKVGGYLIVWAYAREGNFLVRTLVEPVRSAFLQSASHKTLWALGTLINASIWPIVNTVYRLPLKFLPYWAYFENYRKMAFRRNTPNIYDKLNAPQQHFIPEATMREWFNERDFEDIHLSLFMGVSWCGSGRRKA